MKDIRLGIFLLGVSVSIGLAGCGAEKQKLEISESSAVVTTAVAVTKEETMENPKTIPESSASVSESYENWLDGGDDNDEFYFQTCAWLEYAELFWNPGEHKGERLAAAVKITLEDTPVYRAHDKDGNEYYIYDDRRNKDEEIHLNDIVEIYGEFKGLGKDALNRSDVKENDFVVQARLIRPQNGVSSLGEYWNAKELLYGQAAESVPEVLPGQPTGQNNKGILPEGVQDKLDAMMPIYAGLLMNYADGGQAVYNPNDSGYFWSALGHVLSYGGWQHPLAVVDGNDLIIPRIAGQEYAAALFYEYSDLPMDALTNRDGDRILYDADEDAIHCFLGDAGVISYRVLAYRDMGGGTYIVTVQMYDPESNQAICTGLFDLVENPYADAVADPRFYFSVSDADIWMEE